LAQKARGSGEQNVSGRGKGACQKTLILNCSQLRYDTDLTLATGQFLAIGRSFSEPKRMDFYNHFALYGIVRDELQPITFVAFAGKGNGH
jgi:hypothetical protein